MESPGIRSNAPNPRVIQKRGVLEYGLLLNINSQGIQCTQNHLFAEFKLLILWQIGIPGGVRNRRCRQNSIRSYCFRNWNDRANMNTGNAKAFNCFCHRCTATCTCPSVRGQDCCLDSFAQHILGDLSGKLLGTADCCGIAHSSVVIIV